MTIRRTLTVKAIGYVVIIISLTVFCLGLFLFQEGPRIDIVTLVASENHEVFLDPIENVTIPISPFEEDQLAEYSAAGLREFLLNRTISVELQTVDQQTITLLIANVTQLGPSNDLLDHQRDFFMQGVNKLDLEFSPAHPWQTLQLILLNSQNDGVTVNLVASQIFTLSVPRYEGLVKFSSPHETVVVRPQCCFRHFRANAL